MILPAIPVDSSRTREQTMPIERLAVPKLVSSTDRSQNPQALEAEIVRLGNQRPPREEVPAKVAIAPREQPLERIAPSGYRPQHMLYQASAHSVVHAHAFQKKGVFSFHFSGQDILLFCLVCLVAAVITCSVLLIFL
jgi:hypothetical protein